MYVDKLDGLVDTASFDKMSNQWRNDQLVCLEAIERHKSAEKSYMKEGIQLLELARNAQRLFAKQEPREKRRLLNFLVSNCRWNDGELTVTFRQPFDMLAEAVAAPIPAKPPFRRKTGSGWGTWIRTKINGVRVRCSTVELSPNGSSLSRCTE